MHKAYFLALSPEPKNNENTHLETHTQIHTVDTHTHTCKNNDYIAIKEFERMFTIL